MAIPSGNNNQFFGQKVSIPGINVENAGDNQLILKDDYSTRTYYTSSGDSILQLGKFPGTTNGYGLQLIDNNGNIVARYGQQTDGTVNLKFFDTSGIGVAQFGRFSDGTTALKVAKPGIEVSTANNSQLIFNSNQDIFKIVQTDTITLNGAGANSTNTVTVTVTGYNAVPAFLAFGPNFNIGTMLPTFNLTNTGTVGYIVYGNAFKSGTDGKINFSTTNYTGSSDPNVYTIKYYVLQETTA